MAVESKIKSQADGQAIGKTADRQANTKTSVLANAQTDVQTTGRPRWLYWALIAIFLVGTMLRLYQLTEESLWADEAFSIRAAAQEHFPGVVAAVTETEAAPIGYYLFLHYWTTFLGTSEFSVRLPSVLFSLGSLVIFWLLLRRFFPEKVAILSTLFMAISMEQVLYSQEVRLYSLFTFLALLTTYFYCTLLQNGMNSRNWQSLLPTLLPYVISLGAALYVNYLAVVLIIIYTFFFFQNNRFQKKGLKKNELKKKEQKDQRWFWVVLHVLLLLAYFLHIHPMVRAQFSFLNTGIESTLALKGVPTVLASLGPFFYLLPAAFLFLILVLLTSSSSWRERFHQGLRSLLASPWLVASLLVVGISYLYLVHNPLTLGTVRLVAPLTTSYFLIRHSFFFIPGYYLFLAWSISLLRSRARQLISIVVVVMICALALQQYYATPTKTQWREAAEFIQTQSPISGPAPLLILLDKGGPSNQFLLDYYLPAEHTAIKLSWSEPGRRFAQVPDQKLLAWLSANVPVDQGFWLLLSRNPRTDDYYQRLLDQYYRRDQSLDLYQIKVHHYRQWR